MAEYVKNNWYVIAWSDELADGPLARTVCDVAIVVFRGADGQLAAIADRCPHRFVPLSMGKVVEGGLQCGYHGLTFGADGQCIANPHGPVTKRMGVRGFAVVEKYRQIWIWMGEKEEADIALIPVFAYLEDPALRPQKGYMHNAANYELMADNILDLSHIEFLHATSLGTDAIRAAKIQARADGNTVYSERIARNEILPSFLEAIYETGGHPVTRRFDVRWDPPSSMLLVIDVEPAGPEMGVRKSYSSHIFTPETSSTCHYFWSVAHNFGPDDPELDERRREGFERAFRLEDKPMIEAQQRVVGDAALLDLKPLLLNQDAGAILARRTLARLIDHEKSRPDTSPLGAA